MFLASVSKCPARLTNIFFWAVDLWALVFINDPTFLEFVVFVLGGHEHRFYGVCPFEVYLYALFVADFPELFSQTLYVRNHNGNVPLLVVAGGSIGFEVIGLLRICWVGVPVVVVFVFKVLLQSV